MDCPVISDGFLLTFKNKIYNKTKFNQTSIRHCSFNMIVIFLVS